MKFCLLLFFLFLFQNVTFSQKKEGERNYLIDSIFKYSEIDSTKTKYFIDKFIFESKRDNNPKNLFVAYHFLVVYYYKYDDTLKVIENTDRLFAVAKKNNLKIELLKGYHLKNSNLKMTHGLDDPKIFNNIYEALKIAKEIKSDVWECKFNQDIADYYVVIGELDKAVFYYKKNLSILKNLTNTREYKKFKIWGSNLENTYLGLTEIYIRLKKIDSAKLYNTYAKTVLDTTKDAGYKQSYKFMNKIYELEINLLENNPDLAQEHFKEAFELTPEYYKQPTKDFWKNYYSGMISYHKGNFEQAIAFFETLDTVKIQSYERTGIFYNDLYKMLYKSYLKTNNLKEADYYFEKHLASLKGQMDINNTINSNFKKTEIDDYNQEVKMLKKERLKHLLTLFITAVVALFIIFFLSMRFRRKQKEDLEKLKKLVERISKNEEIIAKPKNLSLDISDLEVKRIVDKLTELENKKYYLKMDCTVSNLAKKIKTNTTYLSKIINSYYQKNFTNYINDLRIDFVLDRLKEDNLFRKYSIQSIANEVGFKSKESFNSAFKKRVGMLPSKLIKELDKSL
ncbi:helix-turn-helix transcriptional regulator [Yeosuana marina]|uniref:helix-turn-helix transcriptional regulator n=1 Tax=Yeosuana marina TaxID=1565536 RepID=UPI00141F6706|nr:helix-turn-helix transcriptional regulator [Yeosuana marina]